MNEDTEKFNPLHGNQNDDGIKGNENKENLVIENKSEQEPQKLEEEDEEKQRHILLIGEFHSEQADIEFKEEAKKKAKQGKILFMLEGEIKDDQKENICHLENEAIQYYALLLMYASYMDSIASGKPYVIEKWRPISKTVPEFIEGLWIDALYGVGLGGSIISEACLRVVSNLAPLFNRVKETNLYLTDPSLEIPWIKEDMGVVNDEFIRKHFTSLLSVFEKVAKEIKKQIKSNVQLFSREVRQHPVFEDSFIDNFFVQEADEFRAKNFDKAVVDLRNLIFSEKITMLSLRTEGKNIWVIVGNAHLIGLKKDLEKQRLTDVIKVINRNDEYKWKIFNINPPTEEIKESRLYRLPSLDIKKIMGAQTKATVANIRDSVEDVREPITVSADSNDKGINSSSLPKGTADLITAAKGPQFAPSKQPTVVAEEVSAVKPASTFGGKV